MARKPAGSTRAAKKAEEQNTSFDKDESAKVDVEKDLEDDETKVEWLKRRAKEDEEIKENRSKSVKEWLEVNGDKVLLCKRKKNAGVFKKYWFNKKRHPAAFEKAKKEYEVKKG